MKKIYTIGHSTHTLEEFTEMLQSFKIQHLVDVRGLPGSNKYPQFNKENLEVALPQVGIAYTHLPLLGGRRRVHKDSKNTRWHNASFRAYADYKEPPDFEISDYLKAKGWQVDHIMGIGKDEPHKYTAPARIMGDKVVYYDEGAILGL